MQLNVTDLDLTREPAPDELVDGVACRVEGPVAVVTLCRPEALNALTLAAWRRVGEIFADIAQQERLRAVVVTGAGGRAFSAGANIAEFPDLRMTAAAAFEYNRTIARALEAVMTIEVPVLAMVCGLAVGGGCELAAACDVRVVSDDSRFGVPIGKLGVTLGPVEARALQRLIGPGRLKELLYSGRLVDAEEARAIGLVERVVPRERLAVETAELVASIVANAPATMRALKVVSEMATRPLTSADAEYLTGVTIDVYAGSHLKEGVAAFLERRPPRFTEED